MPEFRLTQISDTHLTRRHQSLTDNFHRVSEYIDATRPDLVVNSGDVAWDAPTNPDDFDFARELHDALPVPCRYLPGNHDIGDNPTAIGPAPSQPVTEQDRQAFRARFGEDRWRFEAAGWCFIGLNSLVMNTGLASEAEQFDWLASAARKRRWQAGGAVPAQAAVSEFARRSRTGGVGDTLHPDAGAQPSCGDAGRGRPAADRQRPRAPAPRFYASPRQARLGAFRRFHRFPTRGRK